jgi:hypothetical protein
LHKTRNAINFLSMNATAYKFWHEHRGLVWSNPSADDSVHLQAALLHPRFSQLLELAVEFGVARLRAEWAELACDNTREVARVRKPVERILNHIERGFALAASRN